MNLGVDQGTMDTLRHSSNGDVIKKLNCLQAYFDQSEPRWSQVVRAVAMYPVNKQRVAKDIAKTHNIDFDKIKEEL